MQNGKFNIVLDCFWGSSGKGKLSTWLAASTAVCGISSANFPNAGHTARFGPQKYVYKAMPTASCLNHQGIADLSSKLYISPASGFSPLVMFNEWLMSGRPLIRVHERACIVTSAHAATERADTSLMGISSTMQGSAAAAIDKIRRYPDASMRPTLDHTRMDKIYDELVASGCEHKLISLFLHSFVVMSGHDFRCKFREAINGSGAWLHEGSQGYALSIDHGSHYPHCTSRNCTTAHAMDAMAVPPSLVGDVYLNLRTFPIRVGNYVDSEVSGYSGDWYPDCEETTWDKIASNAGMPSHVAAALAEGERTTVTKRIRRVSSFSFFGMKDAIATNGATKLALNFVQYLDWKAANMRGDSFSCLPFKVRTMIDAIEDAANLPVVWVGTGADHDDVVTAAGLLLTAERERLST